MSRRPNKYRAGNYAAGEKLTWAPQISVRVPADLKARVRETAEAKEMSISEWVTRLLEEALTHD